MANSNNQEEVNKVDDPTATPNGDTKASVEKTSDNAPSASTEIYNPIKQTDKRISDIDDGFSKPLDQMGNISSIIDLPNDEGGLDDDFSDEGGGEDDLNTAEGQYISYPVPSDDSSAEYYENLYDERAFTTPADFSKDEALRFAAGQGTAAVVRENASLSQNLRTARRQLAISMFVTIALASLLAVMMVFFANSPKTVYIPTKDNRAICEVKPQDNPNINDVTIQEFAKDGVLNLYSIDYANYKNQVDNVLAKWFTPQGRIDTVKAMTDSGILETVNKNALSIKSTALSTSKIETTGTTNIGQKYWIVRFPMVIDIYSGSPAPVNQQKHLVTVRVVADNATALNPQGLGITSVTLSPLAN